MSREHAGPGVRVDTRRLWRLRLSRELPRYALFAVALSGLAASARFAIAPPVAPLPAALAHPPTPPDDAAEGYAVLFARRYLSWSAAEPQLSTQELEAFVGRGMEANAGLEVPARGEQRVEWAEVVQSREPAPAEHVYTVAAQTDSEGLLYLTVPVARTAAGALTLAGYPAFVGPPASEPEHTDEHLREVAEPALTTVVQRALSNYLAGSESELAADLAVGASVSVPTVPLALQSLQRLDWAQEGSAVVATIQASEARGARYTLAYELDVLRTQGRWEVSAVQTEADE